MSRRHRQIAETAARRGFVLERLAEKNYQGHALYSARRGAHLPVFVGSIGPLEAWLNLPTGDVGEL